MFSSVLRRPAAAVVVPARTHTGYIPFEGKLPNIDTPRKRFFIQCKLVNLKPCKKITYTFDPFLKSSAGVRDMMHVLSVEKVRKTNPKCMFKTDVVDDRSEPTVKVELGGDNDGKKVVFKAGLLNNYEILSEFNRILLPMVTEDVKVVTQSKGEKMRKKR
jgi:topoisomerase IA-like protein